MFRTFAGELVHETWGLYSSSCLPRNWCWRARRVCCMIFTRLAHGGKWNGYETLKTLLPHVFVSFVGPDREHCPVAFLSFWTYWPIALINSVTICEQKTEDCARTGSFQHKLQHRFFSAWCLPAFITSLLYQLCLALLLQQYFFISKILRTRTLSLFQVPLKEMYWRMLTFSVICMLWGRC